MQWVFLTMCPGGELHDALELGNRTLSPEERRAMSREAVWLLKEGCRLELGDLGWLSVVKSDDGQLFKPGDGQLFAISFRPSRWLRRQFERDHAYGLRMVMLDSRSGTPRRGTSGYVEQTKEKNETKG